MTFNNADNYKTTQYNVLVGDANNLIANVAPSATSGIPLVSQGSSANPAFGTAVVAGGGTGDTSFTAYSVICGGTTSTGALQNVSGVGTSGQLLTSNGAGLLPTWQTATQGVGQCLYVQTTQSAMSENNVYRVLMGSNYSTSSVCDGNLFITANGTITAAYLTTGSDSTGHAASINIRVNETTDTVLATNVTISTGLKNYSYTGLNISVVAGDYVTLIIDTTGVSSFSALVGFSGTMLLV